MQITKILISAALILVSLTANADVVSSKGKATVKYPGEKVPTEIKDKALFNAQMKAIETYYAEAGDAQAENLDAIRGDIKSDPDRFILESTILQEDDKVADHQYTVTVRVSLNGSNLRNALKKVSVGSNASAGDRSQLAFVFLSRQVETQTTYDARVTKRVVINEKGNSKGSTAEKGVEGESIKKSAITTHAATKSKADYAVENSITAETGGSVVNKSGISTWKLIPSQNLSQIVTQSFKTAGYRVVEAQFVEPLSNGKLKVSAIESDYKSGNDLSSVTLQNVVLGLRNAQVRYLALGTLDVGQVGTDSASGLQRVSVTVNAKVIDVSQTIPESVAVAGPSQFSGVGPTEDEARVNALKLAAQATSRELTSQLTNAGLK
jgi:hypothetical protein